MIANKEVASLPLLCPILNKICIEKECKWWVTDLRDPYYDCAVVRIQSRIYQISGTL
jgi:hypothetical protein